MCYDFTLSINTNLIAFTDLSKFSFKQSVQDSIVSAQTLFKKFYDRRHIDFQLQVDD